jgi:hypothetical protein
MRATTAIIDVRAVNRASTHIASMKTFEHGISENQAICGTDRLGRSGNSD